MVQSGVTFRVSGEAGQRYKLWELVGGEFYIERVLPFTRNLNFFLDKDKVICYSL